MVVAKRYVEEQFRSWSTYHYHHPRWLSLLAEIDKELEQSLDTVILLQKWSRWAKAFLSFYKEIISNELKETKTSEQLFHYRQVKESFRDVHQLDRRDDFEQYEKEAERILTLVKKNIVLTDNEEDIWNEWLRSGWLPHINFDMISEGAKHFYRLTALRFLFGVLIDLTKSEVISSDYREIQFKKVKETCLLADAFEIPSWLWPEILFRVKGSKTELKRIFSHIVEKANRRPLITMNLLLQEDGIGTSEESFFNDFKQAIETENVLKVDRMRVRFENVSVINGWAYQLLALAYTVDKKWVVHFVTPEEGLFLLSSLCDHSLFKYDLQLHEKLAETEGMWGRIEMAEHVLRLFLEPNLRLSFRLLILVYIKNIMGRLIDLRNPDILVWVFNRLIPWKNEQNVVKIRWLARCLAGALQESADSILIRDTFRNWKKPFINHHGLEQMFIEIRERLMQEEHTKYHLLPEWDKSVARIWLERVLDAYKEKDRYRNERVTYLENAIIPILVSRYSQREDVLTVIESLIKRWNRMETEWFHDHSSEETRRNGLLAALLVAVFVAANLEKSVLGKKEKVKEVLLKVLSITQDQRFWNVAEETNSLVQPFEFKEIERAIDTIGLL